MNILLLTLVKYALLLLLNTKSPKIASLQGILTYDKETRTKVVLAKKIGKQRLSNTPVSKVFTMSSQLELLS